jgi:hypothetical protein
MRTTILGYASAAVVLALAIAVIGAARLGSASAAGSGTAKVSSYAADEPSLAYTFLAITNTSSESDTVTVTFRDQAGNTLVAPNSNLAPGATWRLSTASGPAASGTAATSGMQGSIVVSGSSGAGHLVASGFVFYSASATGFSTPFIEVAAEGALPAPTPTPTPVSPPPTPTPTPSPVPYFEGKTIRLFVGFLPGGGTDITARYLAQNLPPFIPGSPSMVVSNFSLNITERNHVWGSAPDGLTLGVETGPGILDQEADGADFDMRDVSVIGITSGKESEWMVWNTVGYDCATDAFGSSAQTITLADFAFSAIDMGASAFEAGWIAEQFNMPLQIIHVDGDTGSSGQMLMIERGDVNSWYTSFVWPNLPSLRPGWVAGDFLRPFLDASFPGYTIGPNSEGPFDCPTLDSLLTSEQRDIWKAVTGPRNIAAKNIIGPPSMDPVALSVLRDALEAAMADPGFVAGLEGAAGLPSAFTPGAEADVEFDATTQLYLDNKATLDALRQDVYDRFVN